MKKLTILLGLVVMALQAFTQTHTDDTHFQGATLYSTVKKYVALGEHRTGTPTDFITSEWLSKELTASGYDVKYAEFSLKQFFLESASVTDQKKKIQYTAFPLWYVSDSIKLDIDGVLVNNASNPVAVKDKIVLLNFSSGIAGQGGALIKKLNSLIDAGAKGIIGYQENAAGEIAAINASRFPTPWKVPVVLVSPADGKNLIAREGESVHVSVKGTFKNVTARNVYGKIGKGEQHIVISTPISGWFNCGGERGPGVAIWLALAKWAAEQKLPYTFVFTGNSGHELGIQGAHQFLEQEAPPVDKTKLWVHLGAGIATLAWRATPSGLIKENTVDANRNFFYSASVKSAFEPAFKNLAGNKWDTKEKAGGELVAVIAKGYPNVVGVTYAHPYFHMKGDDAGTTSPEILEEAALAFKTFIQQYALSESQTQSSCEGSGSLMKERRSKQQSNP